MPIHLKKTHSQVLTSEFVAKDLRASARNPKFQWQVRTALLAGHQLVLWRCVNLRSIIQSSKRGIERTSSAQE